MAGPINLRLLTDFFNKIDQVRTIQERLRMHTAIAASSAASSRALSGKK
jgi:hypothetical protein